MSELHDWGNERTWRVNPYELDTPNQRQGGRTVQSQSKQGEYDDLFKRVLASMNNGRYEPIPQDQHSLIWEVCAEAVDLRHKLGEGRA